MSPDELQLTAAKVVDVSVTLQSQPTVTLQTTDIPTTQIIAAGNVGAPGPQGPPGAPGPEGPQGEWVALTQAEYDALIPKDPETLYVIVV